MSMDKSAIVQIQESANIPEMLNQLVGSQIPLAALPGRDGDFSISSLEKYQENLSRFRGKFETKCIPDFIDYVTKHKGDGVRCFINQETMSAKTIFDLGTVEKPLHKEHTTVLTLKKTAAFKAMMSGEGESLTQNDLIEFMEDWSDNIQAISTTGEEVPIAKAIDSIRSIEIKNTNSVESVQEEFSQHMSAMEKVEMQNRDVQVRILKFKCIPYEGLTDRDFELRISITTTRGIGMKYRMVAKEEVEEQIATEFKDLIKEQLEETKVETFIGTFA